MSKPQYDLAPVQELIDDIDPGWLSRIIDEISFEYSRYLLLDPERCGTDREAAEQLYYLRELRNAIRQVKEKEEEK